MKANANKARFDKETVSKSRADYLEALDADIAQDRAVHGKKPLKEKTREPVIKETKVSTTDPDSGYMVRDGKPKGFFYLDHRTVDSAHALITDSYATPATVHDSIVYLARLDRQRSRFDFDVRAVGLDAGYASAGICKGLEDREITGVIGYRCPEGQLLPYATTDRNGYRHYRSDPKTCRKCPLLASCTSNVKHVKTVTRHVWQDCKDRIDSNRLTPWGKALYKRRKETVERSFADAKQLHGHRYARLRGIEKVREQCLLAAACQNMKKMALILARTAHYWSPHFLKTLRFASKALLGLIYKEIASFCPKQQNPVTP